MHTTRYPASVADRRVVAELLRLDRGADSGQTLLAHLARLEDSPATTQFSTSSFSARTDSGAVVTGEWVATPGTESTGVVLYVHGRRFQHEEPAEVFAARLSAATKLPVLLARYRLAPANPYPAALDDVVATYRALLDQGMPAARIVLVGHSAGATLALSALLTLLPSETPMPAAAVAVSPITDFTFSGESITTNAGEDVITAAEINQVRDAYLGAADPGAAPQSPLYATCVGLPPLLLVCGGAEMLRDDTIRFAQRADAGGVDVTVDIHEAMPHGFPLLPTESAETVFDRIATFTTDRMTGRVRGPARPLSIRRVSWAAYEIVTEEGTRVLVDPYLAGSEGFHSGLPESTVRPEDLTGVDVVAVTHAGYDHRGQAVEITRGGQAVLACGPALFTEALNAGIPADRLAPMVSGVEFQFRDVTIKALPARHDSTMVVNGMSVSDQPMSFLLATAAGSRILCGGDFSLTEDLKTWRELYQPEVAVLGVGGIWVGAVNVTELPPAEAAVAAIWLGVSTVIPVHYPPGDPAPARLTADLTARGSSIEVAALEFGQTWTARAPIDQQGKGGVVSVS